MREFIFDTLALTFGIAAIVLLCAIFAILKVAADNGQWIFLLIAFVIPPVIVGSCYTIGALVDAGSKR